MEYDTIIDETAAILKEGKTILYPTDTIWGLGCDATNPGAVSKIYSIKERKKEKPFLLLVDSIEMLKNYVKVIHPRVETLLVYNKRPLTLIYKNAKNLPDISIANDQSIGIRLTQDAFCKKIINKLGKPLVSTSANKSNKPSPRFYKEVSSAIKNEVDFIVNYKQEDTIEKEPSIIATFDFNGELIVLRS